MTRVISTCAMLFMIGHFGPLRGQTQSNERFPSLEFATEDFCPIELVESFAWTESSMLRRSAVPFDAARLLNQRLLEQPVTLAPANVYLHDPNDGSVIEVQLQGLFGDGTRLEGEFARVGSEKLDGVFDAAPGNGADFRFEPDLTEALDCITDSSQCSRFDAVNMYYHVDRFVRDYWIGQLGVDIDFQADIKVHISGDGGFADYPNRIIKLGVGNIFMKNSALSDDIIYHEYSHLVLSSLGLEIVAGTPQQTRALGEAYADYFTASYTEDPRIGEWVVTCPDRQHCVGPENSTEFRTIDLDTEAWVWNWGAPSDTLKYGVCTRFHEGDGKCKISYNNFANQYVWGMIWAASLWDLRTLVGADIVDQIAVEGVRMHGAEATFEEALSDLHAVALLQFGQGVANNVIQVFEGRGIAPPLVQSTEDELVPSGIQVEYWPNPASTIVTASIRSKRPASWKWSIYDMTGRVVATGGNASSPVLEERLTVPVHGLASGLYVLELKAQQTSIHKRIVVVR